MELETILAIKTMNLSTLIMLIRAGEGPGIEFKQQIPPRSPRDMAKEIAAFSNSDGGIILVGVADNGELVGIEDPDQTMQAISNLIETHCRPVIRPKIDKFFLADNEHHLVWVLVKPDDKGCLVDGRYHYRIGSTVKHVKDWQNWDELRRQHAPDTPAPVLTKPPLSRGFTGRGTELESLDKYLLDESSSIVIIGGLSGSGKTYLASHFASTVSKHNYFPFWIDYRQDLSLDEILIDLSIYARDNGDTELADVLESTNLPRDRRLQSCTSALAKYRYVLFFDSYKDNASDDYMTNTSIDDFIQNIAQQHSSTKVFITTRVRLNIAGLNPLHMNELSLIRGLNLNNCKQFLHNCGLSVSEDQIKEIWRLTGEGHPKALAIFASQARNTLIPHLLESLPVFSMQLREEWLTPLLDGLPQDLRQVVIDLSIFDRPIPFNAIQKLYPESGDESSRFLSDLLGRFILDEVQDGLIWMHLLIREHCYNEIDNLSEKHEWAAKYYLKQLEGENINHDITDSQIPARLAAWSHFIKAGKQERAVEMVEKLRKPLIDEGRYEQLMSLLTHTHPETERDQNWFTINEARIYSLWGEVNQAISIIQPVTNLSDKTLAREAVLVLALIYCDNNRAEEAIGLLQEKSGLFSDISKKSRPIMHRYLSRFVTAYSQLGRHEESLNLGMQLLKIYNDEEDQIGGGKELLNVAESFRVQGELEIALGFCLQASELLKDQNRELARCYLLLGSIYGDLGKNTDALTNTNQAFELFNNMTDRPNRLVCQKQLEDLHKKIASQEVRG